jgi:hypothetical protein
VEAWTASVPGWSSLNNLRAEATFEGELDATTWKALMGELRTAIEDVGLSGCLRAEERSEEGAPGEG